MNRLDHTIALVAGREPDEADVRDAQCKLEAAIAARATHGPARRRRVGGWLAATASAALVTVALLWSPLTSTPAVAFTTIQQHFRDFRTLRFEVEQRTNGLMTLSSRVSVTRTGNVRAEIGDELTVIVNAGEQRVLMLQHPTHVAMELPLRADARRDEALRWLDELREFKGVAEPLTEVRTVDGQPARGWRLEVAGTAIVLWASDEGLPLQMIVGDAPALQLDFHFEFDVDFSPETFSTAIPAGYSPRKEED